MLEILRAPDPVLRATADPCEPGDEALKEISEQMAEVMYNNNGCGLAAPQVGLSKRLIVIDVAYDTEDESSRDPIVLVNPEIVELAGDPVIDGEGCLSCPGISVPIKRKPYAKVRYYNLDGELWEIAGDGLLGRCLQHEIDHLNGITLFESVAPELRIDALNAYEEAKAQGLKPGETGIEVKVR